MLTLIQGGRSKDLLFCGMVGHAPAKMMCYYEGRSVLEVMLVMTDIIQHYAYGEIVVPGIPSESDLGTVKQLMRAQFLPPVAFEPSTPDHPQGRTKIKLWPVFQS